MSLRYAACAFALFAATSEAWPAFDSENANRHGWPHHQHHNSSHEIPGSMGTIPQTSTLKTVFTTASRVATTEVSAQRTTIANIEAASSAPESATYSQA
ncbi:hypothetical protein EV356DRAFT_503642 [Viridothelium virens]|uniref:Uncharacterized protein n=1 Tax=Viridothelium virens TaxID=1048519 RepID=A0A6A6H5R0_VIRVR|nr:hypothetical protein EV356DRAFT_503642 [Viridothelium virens]